MFEPFNIRAFNPEELFEDCKDEMSVSGGTKSLSVGISIWGCSSSSSCSSDEMILGGLGFRVVSVAVKEENREKIGRWRYGFKDGLWVRVLGFRGRVMRVGTLGR